ncbi:relaxase/mobilization nuclease domain-containing protein [Okeania sp. SIO1I7]|uniref:relaxase/mobilization nuclease domain-containing protein n=1 Tax=Okeania sp. SIO1I7 TaxID=2607772 RepID=UPI0025F78107|nr:relaxase/mobilization nuclease domain-containing protein [Okeania sp. SIO1I7]
MIGKVTRNAKFHSVASYIFGKPGAEALLENVFEGKTVAEKAASMQWVASRNNRVKRPAYHLSLSPSAGDNLSRGEWAAICSQVIDDLNLDKNQVLVGLHNDVKYPDSSKTRTHAHLLINLVDDCGKCANTSWDYYKIPKILRDVERKYGLQAVPDIGELEEQSNAIKPTKRSIRQKLQNIIDESLEPGSSFEDLTAAMESLGVEVHPTSQGWWMRYEGIPFAGYQLGRKYTKPSILKRLEAKQVDEYEDREQRSESVSTPISSMKDVFTVDEPSLGKDYSPELNSEQDETSQNEEQFSLEDIDIDVAPGNLIVWMKQQANHLEQSDYIDGRFYAGMFLDVTAHLAEVVEIGREVWSEEQEQEQETETQLEENSRPSVEISQSEGDDDWLHDEEALRHFDERLAQVKVDTETPSSDVPTNIQESPQAVAESLSQFVRVRATAHDLNQDEPIETNLGVLHFNSDENTISITQDITVASWDENLQEWQIDSDLSESHQANVARLLDNQAVDTEGYQFSSDEKERTITYKQVRFRAEQTDDGWQISDNSLSSEEQHRILQLPQTESEYTQNVDSKDLIDYFQRHAPEQFRTDIGSIHWTDTNGEFERVFEISKQSDLSYQLEGFDLKQTDEWGNPRKIFSASIEADNFVRCDTCEIPTSDVDDLLTQESQHRGNRPEMER